MMKDIIQLECRMKKHRKTMSWRPPRRHNQSIDSEIATLAEIATANGMDLRGFRREVLQRLAMLVGYDAASLCQTMNPSSENDPVFLSPLQVRDWHQYCQNWKLYWAELQLLANRDCLLGDASMTNPRTGRHLTVYEDILRPCGMKHFFAMPVVVRDLQVAVVTMMRPPGISCFTSRDINIVRCLLPVITLGENLLIPGRRNPKNAPSKISVRIQNHLSPREFEVARYVAIGLTNTQIALACGKSAATVHNQLVSVFRKLDISSRSELVRILLDEEAFVPKKAKWRDSI
jgi:DNA-binding CsgD family transcriptional regulator